MVASVLCKSCEQANLREASAPRAAGGVRQAPCEPGFHPGQLPSASGSAECPRPCATGTSVGHRHFGAETGQGRARQPGQCGRLAPPGTVRLCGHSQRWGSLLTWTLLRPDGRVWGLSLWSLQTDYDSAPGYCFQSLVSEGELVPEPWATGGRGRQARSGLWDQPFPSEQGPSAQQKPGGGADCGSSVTVQEEAGTCWDLGRPLGQHGPLHRLLQ